MSDAALDHPLVRAYLRKLDEALASLPSERAAELCGQIAAHLAEELPPGATDEEAAGAIGRMGTPADLAREAGARPRRTLRTVLRRRSWTFWASTSAVLAGAGALVGLLVSIDTAPVLDGAAQYGWWYQQDLRHSVDTTADGAQQFTIPVRWHQRQGFFVQLYNDSGYTQTILGYAPGTAKSPGNFLNTQLGVSTDPDVYQKPATDQRYALPVSIPPHQSRYLRVLWTNDICMAEGGTQSIDQLTLRVRVGWITRAEVVSLSQAWAIEGTRESACAGS